MTTPTRFSDAADTFLAHSDFAASTIDDYRRTLAAITTMVGNPPLDYVDTDQLTDALDRRWGHLTPGTYNRRRAALVSLWNTAVKRGWTDHNPANGIDRRHDPTIARSSPVLATAQLEAMWTDPDHRLRECTLWVMLYETAAPATTILNLNVDHLALDTRTATTPDGPIWWTATTDTYLRRHLTDRNAGPVFIAARRPTRATPPADIDPNTGRRRLSYRRAAELFAQASEGRTLHDLRRAAITHHVQAGLPDAILQAKTRHACPRSLRPYATTGT